MSAGWADLWSWIVHACGVAYSTAFDGSLDFARRLLAMAALIALITVPCAVLATLARLVVRHVRRLVKEAEAKHPLVLVGFGDGVARDLGRAAHLRDELSPAAMSLERLSIAIDAAETLLQHARTI